MLPAFTKPTPTTYRSIGACGRDEQHETSNEPPAKRALPSGRSAAVACRRGCISVPADAKVPPLDEVNSSAWDVAFPPASAPPARSTRPSASRTAVCQANRVALDPAVAVKLDVTGSKISADGPEPKPPASRTRPSARSVAVCRSRAPSIVPTDVNDRSDGVY